MRIVGIGLQNYRTFERQSVRLDQLSLLLGTNGAGKSSLLDALATVLSRVVARTRGTQEGTIQITESDQRTGGDFCGVAVWASLPDNGLWHVIKHHGRRGETRGTEDHIFDDYHDYQDSNLQREEEAFRDYTKRLGDTVRSDPTASVPVVTYYRTNRAILDIPLRIGRRHQFDQFAALEGALQRTGTNFRVFFEWFRWREDIENEARRDDPDYRDRQLTAVRAAIEAFLPGYDDLRVQRSPRLRMVVRKHGQKLEVNQLSDGEKCLLAMVGDIARRLAIANPAAEEPLAGEGIVLIDEIELHLHPSWQRRVLPTMRRVFPNLQLIATTQSPLIAADVPAGCVQVLRQGQNGTEVWKPTMTYGADVNTVLEVAMETGAQPDAVEARLKAIDQALDTGDLPAAQAGIGAFTAEYGELPAIVQRQTVLAFRARRQA